MKPIALTTLVAATLALGACAVAPPSGPSVLVLPGEGKSFDQFRADDYECRQFASSQIGGAQASQAAVNSGLTSAAVGTAVGAAAGALINGSNGAAVGAGSGLLIGSAGGVGAAEASANTLQQRYDIGYQQCMYAKGNKVPMASQPMQRRRSGYGTPPPPPPPGYYGH
jgi:hypothetical protein